MQPEDYDPTLDPAIDNVSRRSFLENMSWRSVLDAFMGQEAAAPAKKPSYLADANLDHEDVTFESAGRRIEAFLCKPKSEGKRGSVILIHEVFGLNDHIRDIACRLAKAGYDGLAADFFTREGHPPQELGPAMSEFVGRIADPQVLTDIGAAAQWLRGRPTCNGRVAVMGFGWGGRFAILGLAQLTSIDAGVAYYGRIRGPATETAGSALDVARSIGAPLLCHYGGRDTAIPRDDVLALKAELEEASSNSEVHIYEDAGHAFSNETRASYHDESSRLAWRCSLEWLDRYCK